MNVSRAKTVLVECVPDEWRLSISIRRSCLPVDFAPISVCNLEDFLERPPEPSEKLLLLPHLLPKFFGFILVDDNVEHTSSCAFWTEPYNRIRVNLRNDSLDCLLFEEIFVLRDSHVLPAFLRERC